MSTHFDAARDRPVFPRLSRLRTAPLRQVDDRTVSGLGLLFTRPARPSVLSCGGGARQGMPESVHPLTTQLANVLIRRTE